MNENIVRMPPGNAPDIHCHHYTDGKWEDHMIYVPQELPLAIYINGRELVTILCSPSKLNFLVVGYLFAEGIIKNENRFITDKDTGNRDALFLTTR